jgi:hypothetical protein
MSKFTYVFNIFTQQMNESDLLSRKINCVLSSRAASVAIGPTGPIGAQGPQGTAGTNGSSILGLSNTFTATNTFQTIVTNNTLSLNYGNIPSFSSSNIGYQITGTVNSVTFSSPNSYYNIASLDVPLGVWIITWKAGINCTVGAQSYSIKDFGITETSTGVPNQSREIDSPSNTQGFSIISPCYVTSGSEVYRTNIVTFQQGKNVLYLTGKVVFTSTARLSSNTTESYLRGIRIA